MNGKVFNFGSELEWQGVCVVRVAPTLHMSRGRKTGAHLDLEGQWSSEGPVGLPFRSTSDVNGTHCPLVIHPFSFYLFAPLTLSLRRDGRFIGAQNIVHAQSPPRRVTRFNDTLKI